MIRVFLILFVVAVTGVISMAGFRGQKFTQPPLQVTPDMKHQPKVITQHGSRFFADGRADHPLIPGTLPVGYNLQGRYYQSSATNLKGNDGFTSQPTYKDTGLMGDVYGDGLPVTLDEKLIERGHERYDIFCAVCHDKTGSGNGVAKSFGLVTVASLVDDRIKGQPDGQIFSTITNGKNTMGAYGPNIAVEDRWAIVAYLRVLQRSQSVNVDALAPEIRAQLEKK